MKKKQHPRVQRGIGVVLLVPQMASPECTDQHIRARGKDKEASRYMNETERTS